MFEFQLFRLRVIMPEQRSLLDTPPPAATLRAAVEERPEAQLGRGVTWHVGNVETVDENAVYFRVGKTTRATVEMYRDGQFEDEELETSPYTHVLLDTDLGVCGIAGRSRLAQRTAGIARQLRKLLDQSQAVREVHGKLEIGEIQDPDEFVDYIRSARKVVKFWITFSRPNPWDVNQDFVRPMERYLQEVNGNEGKVSLKGEELDADHLEELSRSAASTGDDAGARLQLSDEGAIVNKRLRGRSVTLQQDSTDQHDWKVRLLRLVREAYQRVRG